MRKVEDLVGDIYRLLESKEVPEGVDLEAVCEQFGNDARDLMLAQFKEDFRSQSLRLSQIGKPDRQLYHAYHSVVPQRFRGNILVKFLYGHLIESMVIALTRLSGHTVTDEQKEVSVEGVTGHMDCRIDGVLTDVKSCSSYGFKKFKENKLHEDDPFGYIGQLRAYAHAEGDTTYGWLAMDKQNGHLAWLQYDETKTNTPYYDAIQWSVPQRVIDIKKLVEGDLPPLCYDPVPDGKSGNMKLPTGCAYCDFKFQCYPDLRVFYYGSGPRYLTTVKREPRVEAREMPKEF